MLDLLTVICAAAFGATVAVITLVAWAIHREDACLTMTDHAQDPVFRGVRRMLGVHVMGMTGPARPDPADDPYFGYLAEPDEDPRTTATIR
jgi:hypothetical protein